MIGVSSRTSATVNQQQTKEALVMVLRAAAALSAEIELWTNGRPAGEMFDWIVRHLERTDKFQNEDAEPDGRSADIEQDAEDYQGAFSRGWLPEPDEAGEALAVLILTPHIRAYLEAVDPMALRQARSALRLAAQTASAGTQAAEAAPLPSVEF